MGCSTKSKNCTSCFSESTWFLEADLPCKQDSICRVENEKQLDYGGLEKKTSLYIGYIITRRAHTQIWQISSTFWTRHCKDLPNFMLAVFKQYYTIFPGKIGIWIWKPKSNLKDKVEDWSEWWISDCRRVCVRACVRGGMDSLPTKHVFPHFTHLLQPATKLPT